MTVANMQHPERSITITIDGDGPTPDELSLYAGLMVNAEQFQKDNGHTFHDLLSELTVKELIEFRSRLQDDFGDADQIEADHRAAYEAAVDAGQEPQYPADKIIWLLLRMIEHEIGGRWVNPH